jgi:hypothetical protein
MYDLPKRESEIVVTLHGGEVKIVMEPLSDEEFFRLNETADTRGEGKDLALVYRLSADPGLFERKLIRIEGAQVDGEPFDRGNAAHMERIPLNWKSLALGRLIRYANGLTETERGNSKQPAESSTAAGTSSQG